MIDLLIKNGLVIDGTGSPGFYAAVLVDGDTVTIRRGDASGIEAAREIDASGLVVCPGFVDIHSHAGLTILGEPHHDPKVRQGVTTELVGIDGISHAPFKSQDELHRYIWLDSGLNGYPRCRPTGSPWRSCWASTTTPSPSTWPTSSATLPCGYGRSAGTTGRPLALR